MAMRTTHVSRKSTIKTVATLFALAATASFAHAETSTLNVSIYGGSFLDNTKACVGVAFSKATGANVRYMPASTSQTMAKMRAEKGAPTIDVAYLDSATAEQAANEGLLAPLDASKVPNLVDIYPSARDKDNRYVGMLFSATAIAYNPKLVKAPPTSWKDLWKPEYKGMVAIGDISGTSGQQFLIAASRLSGGDEKNVDPGFKAIASLRPNVNMYYSQADQVVSQFQQGDIAMAVWYPDRAAVSASKGLDIKTVLPSEGAIGILSTLAVPQGSKQATLAQSYINAVLSPDVQSCFAGKSFVGPTNEKTRLPADVASKVPYGDAVKHLYFPSAQVVNKSLTAWTERWGREITH